MKNPALTRIDIAFPSGERQITVFVDTAAGWAHAFERVKRGRHWRTIHACDLRVTVTLLSEDDARDRIARGWLEYDTQRDPARSLLAIADLRFRSARMPRENGDLQGDSI